MTVLLDTHALIWWLTDDTRRLPTLVRRAIGNESNNILISAVSAFEIVNKHRLGRLAAVDEFVDDIGAAIANEGFHELPLSLPDAMRAGALPGPLRDPFDRMLIAQSLNHDLTLISNEVRFDSYGVRRLW